MSFNPNAPQVTDPLLQSYSQLRSNFQDINNAFADNHVGLTQDPLIAGMHNSLILRRQLGDPTTSSTQTALYNKIVNNIPQLFFRPNSSQTPIQLTYQSIQTGLQSTKPDVYYPQQYSFIAGPFIVYGGIIESPSNGQPVTLSPSSTLIYVDLIATNSTLKPSSRSATTNATNLTGSSFIIGDPSLPSTALNFDIYYLAIGKP